jgi:hypothetical protein
LPTLTTLLEDLGRGSTGKAWLCVTITKPRSAVCVMKFDNKSDTNNLIKESNMWKLLYPEFSNMIEVQLWSGDHALVMPHFSTVKEQEREQYREEVRNVLTDKFMSRGKVHRDVCWRNIGKYTNNHLQVVIVVFDLHDVVDFNDVANKDWINESMRSLYAEA